MNPNIRGQIAINATRRIPSTYSNQYNTRYGKDWIWKDFIKFIAIILCMGLIHNRWLTKYFNQLDLNQIYGSNLISKAMKKYKFLEMLACLDGDIRFIISKSDIRMKQIFVWTNLV